MEVIRVIEEESLNYRHAAIEAFVGYDDVRLVGSTSYTDEL